MKVSKLAPLLLLILVLTGCSLGLDGIEIYKGKLEKPEQMLVSFTDAQAFSLKDGRILIYGKGFRPHNSHYQNIQGQTLPWQIFDPTSKRYSLTGAPHEDPGDEAAVMLADGRVLLTGGGIWGTSNRTQIYEPSTGQFVVGPRMLYPRARHSVTTLQDGMVLLAGGLSNTSPKKTIQLKSAELFDPKRGKFIPTGSMTDNLSLFNKSFWNYARDLCPV